MPETEKLLDLFARRSLPAFVTGKSQLRLLRRLRGAGYVEARFFPEVRSADQFAEVVSLTPLGRRVLRIVAGESRRLPLALQHSPPGPAEERTLS